MSELDFWEKTVKSDIEALKRIFKLLVDDMDELERERKKKEAQP